MDSTTLPPKKSWLLVIGNKSALQSHLAYSEKFSQKPKWTILSFNWYLISSNILGFLLKLCPRTARSNFTLLLFNLYKHLKNASGFLSYSQRWFHNINGFPFFWVLCLSEDRDVNHYPWMKNQILRSICRAIRSIKGVKSKPPLGGNTLRMCFRTGSTGVLKNLTAGWPGGSFVHERIALTTTNKI